jgi:hypothetical protein
MTADQQLRLRSVRANGLDAASGSPGDHPIPPWIGRLRGRRETEQGDRASCHGNESCDSTPASHGVSLATECPWTFQIPCLISGNK